MRLPNCGFFRGFFSGRIYYQQIVEVKTGRAGSQPSPGSMPKNKEFRSIRGQTATTAFKSAVEQGHVRSRPQRPSRKRRLWPFCDYIFLRKMRAGPGRVWVPDRQVEIRMRANHRRDAPGPAMPTGRPLSAGPSVRAAASIRSCGRYTGGAGGDRYPAFRPGLILHSSRIERLS